ncbi:MAG: hypothetical protein LBT80_05125 [Lactobacillaceae bacterium]|jgi:hypothetical protein|nr:hypothetical protein [Lactobacillaceae bacterium]
MKYASKILLGVISCATLASLGQTGVVVADTWTGSENAGTMTGSWTEGDGNTVVEYTIEPSYSIQIPDTITLTDENETTTTGEGVVTLSANPLLPYAERYIHIGLISSPTDHSGANNAWQLTNTNDTTGVAYKLGKDKNTDTYSKEFPEKIEFTADGQTDSTQTANLFATLTGSKNGFKYAATYTDTVTFTITTDDIPSGG